MKRKPKLTDGEKIGALAGMLLWIIQGLRNKSISSKPILNTHPNAKEYGRKVLPGQPTLLVFTDMVSERTFTVAQDKADHSGISQALHEIRKEMRRDLQFVETPSTQQLIDILTNR